MGMIAAFRKLLYAQVILGVIAYAVAEQNAAMVLAAGALGTLSWYVVEGPGGRALPRWVINLGVLGAAAWLLYSQAVAGDSLILSLGKFILVIQICKLYENKTNRDYAQMIVLSLMQMVCGAIISAEFIFGVLLAVYLGVALFTVLLFQLKLGYDQVAAANRAQAPPRRRGVRPRSVVSRGHRRQFRRLAVVTGAVTLALSAVLFVGMPRGRGKGVLGEWSPPGGGRRQTTGYSDEVRLSGGQRIGTNPAIVMNVRVFRGGRQIGSEQRPMLLRGRALDRYDRKTDRWRRSRRVRAVDRSLAGRGGGGGIALASAGTGSRTRQQITLRADTGGTLFAAYAPVWFSGVAGGEAQFNAVDQVLRCRVADDGRIEYTVESVDPQRRALFESYRAKLGDVPDRIRSEYARGGVLADPRIERLTRSVMERAGLTRPDGADVTPEDARIASAVERYLRQNYRYTLDLPPIGAERDPILAFLFDHRAGHCEFFASAMCAMLRSVGVRSRLITGFRATEYNEVGGYYVVRQKNAHAWVEVWTSRSGWRPYDPSPPAQIEQIHRPAQGVLVKLRDFYEYLEFEWMDSVITFNDRQRRSVIGRVDSGLGSVTKRLRAWAGQAGTWLRNFHRRWMLGAWGYAFLGGVVAAIGLAVVVFVRTMSHRKRAIRQLQLGPMSNESQRRLTVHLEFYLRMLKLLRKAGYPKPVNQTPASFAEDLVQRDADRFNDVVALTDLFYEIRFGDRPLDGDRARRIQQHLDHLKQRL